MSIFEGQGVGKLETTQQRLEYYRRHRSVGVFSTVFGDRRATGVPPEISLDEAVRFDDVITGHLGAHLCDRCGEVSYSQDCSTCEERNRPQTITDTLRIPRPIEPHEVVWQQKGTCAHRNAPNVTCVQVVKGETGFGVHGFITWGYRGADELFFERCSPATLTVTVERAVAVCQAKLSKEERRFEAMLIGAAQTDVLWERLQRLQAE